jgi:hypothetical protein
MSFFEIIDSVALVKIEVSEERIASIIKVTKVGEVETLAVTSNRRTLQRNAVYCVLCTGISSQRSSLASYY